jgi:broad specificity phosphatase PhoE
MPKTIFLIRHAETRHNAEKIVQGWLDIPLNSNGIRQAKKLAQRLKNETIHAIYSSDLSRSLDTAKEVAAVLGQKVKISKKLREWNMGIWEGKSWDWVDKNFHDLYDELGKIRDIHWKGHGGESMHEAIERARYFLNHLSKKHKNDRVAIFSHGGTLRRILHLLNIETPKDFRGLANASLTVLRKNKDGTYSAKMIADTRHLSEEDERRTY